MDHLGHRLGALVLAGPLFLLAPAVRPDAPALPGAAVADSVAGWRVGARPKAARVLVDSAEKHGGAVSAHLVLTPQDAERPAGGGGGRRGGEGGAAPDPNAFPAYFAQSLDATPFRGRRVKLSMWVRTRLPDKPAPKMPPSRVQAFLRVENGDETMTLYDGSISPITATSDWTRKVIVMEVAPEAMVLSFGISAVGQGDVWVDDVTLEDQAPAMGPYQKQPMMRRRLQVAEERALPTELVNGDFEVR